MFKNTDIPYEVLTAWILAMFKRYKVTDIRYFGSRVHGSPREDSDIMAHRAIGHGQPT